MWKVIVYTSLKQKDKAVSGLKPQFTSKVGLRIQQGAANWKISLES